MVSIVVLASVCPLSSSVTLPASRWGRSPDAWLVGRRRVGRVAAQAADTARQTSTIRLRPVREGTSMDTSH